MTINLLLAATMLLNFMLVATGRVNKAIQLAAIQGSVLALILLLMHDHWPFHVMLMALSTVAIKSAVIP